MSVGCSVRRKYNVKINAGKCICDDHCAVVVIMLVLVVNGPAQITPESPTMMGPNGGERASYGS